jgi:hypothetical protein
MDVRFCLMQEPSAERQDVRKRQVLITAKTRSPERVRESRAFLLTSDLHGCRSLARNAVDEDKAGSVRKCAAVSNRFIKAASSA